MPDPDLASVHEARAPVAALILAAGEARRMGSAKVLLPWRGRSLVRHCAEVALASRCDEVYLIVGTDGQTLEREVEDLDVEVIHHAGWRQGMGSTIAAALARLGDRLAGAVILLCDQPFVTPELLDRLLELGKSDASEMAACRYHGTLGPPAFFAASVFAQLKALTGERGAKSLLLENPESVACIDFPLGAFDLDTPADYARALDELVRQTGSP